MEVIVDTSKGVYKERIVRCKECKYWRAYETWSECELWTDDPYESAKTNADDFCSYGERERAVRLIDADAIQIPKTHADAFENCRNCELLDADQVREIIDSAPTIEPKRGKWIPCSERLPKENGRYLVTFPSLINKPWIDILWYGRPTFPETDHPCFYASDDEYGDVEYDDVVAWMPLPKPYEEREDE